MDTDFKIWMTSLGYGGKEVSKAGETIGIGMTSSRERYRGEKELSLTERLAMTAIAMGLPAWEPSKEIEIEAYRKVIEAVQEVLNDRRYRNVAASTEQHIPAE